MDFNLGNLRNIFPKKTERVSDTDIIGDGIILKTKGIEKYDSLPKRVFNYGWAPQLFGARRPGGRRHAGIDLGTGKTKGVPAGCPLDGFKVLAVQRRSGYGNTVDLISEDGTKMMRFAHLAHPLPKHLKPGDPVRKGDWLGNVGNTGGNYAIHLHFEYRVRQGGIFLPVNPVNNKYHSFRIMDFEDARKMAEVSRSRIKSGMTLADTHTLSPIKDARLASAGFFYDGKNTYTNLEQKNSLILERTFNQPTWWERIAHPWFGGWTKADLKEADERRRLDEEVFLGVKRKDLKAIGMSDDDISKLQSHVAEKMKVSDPRNTLGQKAVEVDFNEVLNDKETADKATDYFAKLQKRNNTMG